jgi:pimeloyl-ACP methyl ester carboxylesterase
MWHLVAPRLAEEFSVVLPDLRGYGESSKPPTMLGWWHWAFLAQPAPLPELLIGANPDGYYFGGDRSRFHPDALADYLRCARDPETIHAMCEDYRAGAGYDFELDEADRAAHRRIACPVLVLWAGQDDAEKLFGDPLVIWRDWADDVSGRASIAGTTWPKRRRRRRTASCDDSSAVVDERRSGA